MEDLYADQLMSRPVETVTPSTPIQEAADVLIKHDVGAVVVVDEAGEFEGLLTTTDFVQIVRQGTGSPDATVAEFMQTEVVTTTRSAPVSDVVETMLERLIHHVPVVEGDRVVGIITTLDLAAYLSRSL